MFEVEMFVSHFCSSGSDISLENAVRSFPYKLMPFVAVIQLVCWGVYAEGCYSMTGDNSQLWYAGFGFVFPGSLLLPTALHCVPPCSSLPSDTHLKPI